MVFSDEANGFELLCPTSEVWVMFVFNAVCQTVNMAQDTNL